jgi:hypothetical protein
MVSHVFEDLRKRKAPNTIDVTFPLKMIHLNQDVDNPTPTPEREHVRVKMDG